MGSPNLKRGILSISVHVNAVIQGIRKQSTGKQSASEADCEGKSIKKQRKEEHALQNTLLNTVSPTASENLAVSHSDF